MPRSALSVALAAAVVIYSSGCGTIRDALADPSTKEGMRVYGGVRNDLESAQFNDPFFYPPISPRPPTVLKLCLGTIYAIDLPLSGIADTLLLPFTLVAASKEKADLTPPTLENDAQLLPQNKSFDRIHEGIE